jgi:hypothetical protein
MPTAQGSLVVESMLSGVTGGAGVESLFDVEQVLFVDNSAAPTGTEDGTLQDPFQDIQDAMTAAAALTPAADNRIGIIVFPGLYTGFNSEDYVTVSGIQREGCIVQDAGTALVADDDHCSFRNLTFHVTGTTSPVVSVTAGLAASPILFFNCVFLGANDDTTQVEVSGGGECLMRDCYLSQTAGATTAVLCTGNGSTLELHDCRITGSAAVATQSDLILRGCTVDSSDPAGAIQSPTSCNALIIDDCQIVSADGHAIALTQQPDRFEVTDSVLTAGDAASFSVYAAVAVPDCVIENNTMHIGGIHSNIQSTNTTKYVGSSGMRDWFSTSLEAILAVGASTALHVIELLKNETVTANITMASTNNILYKGNGYTMTRAGLLFGTNSAVLEVEDLQLSGYLSLYGGTSQLTLCCCALTGYVTLSGVAAGGFLRLKHTNINSPSAVGAIDIQTANPDVFVDHSYLRCSTAAAAIQWNNGVTNDNVQIKYSTILHGSLGANNPFGRDAAQTPNYSSHHSEYNVDPQTGGVWTNLVAAAQCFDGYDVNTDY